MRVIPTSTTKGSFSGMFALILFSTIPYQRPAWISLPWRKPTSREYLNNEFLHNKKFQRTRITSAFQAVRFGLPLSSTLTSYAYLPCTCRAVIAFFIVYGHAEPILRSKKSESFCYYLWEVLYLTTPSAWIVIAGDIFQNIFFSGNDFLLVHPSPPC